MPVIAPDPDGATPARLRIVAAAILFSTGGAAIKACSLSGLQVACLRAGFAALTLIAILPGARRAASWSIRALLVGVIYAATMVLFVVANKLTTAANAIFIQAASPLFVLLLGPFALREPVRGRDLWFMLALAAGMSLFFVGAEQPLASAPDPARGNLAAAAAAAAFALTVVGLRWAVRDSPGADSAALVAGNAIAFTACLPWALPLTGVGAADWGIAVFLGAIQIALAYTLLASGMKHVRALDASLLLLVEPVLNPIWAWLAHGEHPGGLALAGGAVILAATAAHSRAAGRAGGTHPSRAPRLDAP